jgi:hypothetical protein
MKNRFQLLPFSLILILGIIGYILTNSFRTKRLTELEKQSIPYKGNEVLVFKSNKSELDTIRITEVSIREHPPNLGDMFWAKNTEVLRVHNDIDCKNCDAIITYSVQNFSSKTEIYYDLRINGKRYYLKTDFKTLNKSKPEKLLINGIELNDAVLIKREPEKNHSEHIDGIYWSKSKGIVRINIKSDYYWELINR